MSGKSSKHTKIGVVVSKKKVVASATPGSRQDQAGRTRQLSLVGRLGRRFSPRVSPTSAGGQAEAELHRGLRKAFVRRAMASEEVDDVEDMETEMSPERKSTADLLFASGALNNINRRSVGRCSRTPPSTGYCSLERRCRLVPVSSK